MAFFVIIIDFAVLLVRSFCLYVLLIGSIANIRKKM